MKLQKDLKTIWIWLKPFKKRLVVYAILATVTSIISAFIPYLYGHLVDSAIGGKSYQYLLGAMGLWLLMSLFSDRLGRFNSKKGGETVVEAEGRLVCTVSDHIIRLPLSYLYSKKIGEIMRKVTHAGNHLEQVLWIFIDTGPSFLTVLIALGFLFFINLPLTGLLALILIIYGAATIYKTKPILKANTPMNRAFEISYGHIWDTVANTQVVKSNSNIDYEKSRAEDNFRKSNEKFFQFNSYWNKMDAWQQIIFAFGFVSLFGLAVYFLREGAISTGNLVTFIGYVSLVFAPFGKLSNNYRQFRKAVDSIERANQIMREKPEKYYQQGNKILEQVRGEVEFKNLSFAYEKSKTVLKNINLKVKAGEVIALVGKTGAGKSTFVDLISGYYLPTRGNLLIDGNKISDLNTDSLRDFIAYVPQETSLFNDQIARNIKYGHLTASNEDMIAASKAANADEFIQKLSKKYQTVVGERGVKLSVGQKQRVAIARAILRDPKILILDEATSSLDSVTEKLVQEALDRLLKGRTAFVIAHRLSTIQKADRILVLEDGRIVEQGTHQQLLKNTAGHYYKLYTTQNLFKED